MDRGAWKNDIEGIIPSGVTYHQAAEANRSTKCAQIKVLNALMNTSTSISLLMLIICANIIYLSSTFRCYTTAKIKFKGYV